MTGKVTEDDLAPWRDALEILTILTEAPTEELRSVRDSIHRLLRHEDVDVRAFAVRRLFVHLRDQDHHEDSVALLRNDSDSEVRRVAAFGVASTSSPSTRKRDIAVLLDSLLNENEHQRVRGASYEALLLLHDRRDFPPVKRDTDLSRDVDWVWINSLRAEYPPSG